MAAAFDSGAFDAGAFEVGGGVPATHATSGALTGPGSSVAGSAANFRAFATTGALTGQIGSVAGSASNFTVHSTSGVLAGQTATLVGAADHAAGFVTHTTSGVLAGQGSTVVGSTQHKALHTTTGALTGQIGSVVGASNRFRVHPSTGVLTGQNAILVGSSSRTRTHLTTGVLISDSAIVIGSAAHVGAFVTHDTTGILIGPGAIVTGEADPPSDGGGGPGNSVSVQPRKPKGWANERAQFEQSQETIDRIAQTLTESKQPQVQRIARKLVDYTGDLEELASLQRELAKLESAKQTKLLEAERNQEIKSALAELNDILQDDEDAAEAIVMFQEMETRQLMAILALR